MSFLTGLIWITVFYGVYYFIIFAIDAITARTVNETTGVEEFTVSRPKDDAVKVVAIHDQQEANASLTGDNSENEEQYGGSQSFAQKKK